jgi:hypothetical protein
MAFTTESLSLNFENPYKNPYESGITPAHAKFERHWSGSTIEHSQYTEKDEWDVEEVYVEKHDHATKDAQAVEEHALPFQNITAPDAIRTLSFYHPGCHRKNLIIKDDGGKTIYYADVSRCSSAPDIVLHTGETKDHPITAIARFRWSRHLRLGLGDPVDELALFWKEMKNMKRLAHSQYRLEVTSNELDGFGERRSIVFQRTHAKKDGVTNRLSCMNYKVVDEGTGEVLAVYLATGWKSWKKRATLHIKSECLAGDAEVLVVLGMCGLVEKKWRRDARNSGG